MSGRAARERERFAERCREVGIDDRRFIDVYDGEKETRNHTRFTPDDPRLFGNYGVYAGRGNDPDGPHLVDVDVDHYDGADTAAVDALPETFAVESPHTTAGSPGHRYYLVEGNVVDRIKEIADGTVNPSPAWGEVRVENQYVVGPGSQLDGCDKDWCDECARDDGGYYRIANDVPIATITADALIEVLCADPAYPKDDEDDEDDEEVERRRQQAQERIEREPDVEAPGVESWDSRLELALDRDDTLDALFHARSPTYDHDDRSKSEWRLAKRLAYWLGGDRAAVRQALERSRAEKWHERSDDDYRDSCLKAVDKQREFYDPERNPEADGPAESGADEPVPSIPFGALTFEPDELRRYAKKRGLEWPSTDEVRERLTNTAREALESKGYTVIDAPTSSGKTHEIATTEWASPLEVDEDVTGDRPVVILASTREAREEAATMADEAGVDAKVLLGYQEACEAASGDHDPENTCGNDPLYLKGTPLGKWISHHVEERSISISVVHWYAEHFASLGYLAHDKQASIRGEGDVEHLPCCPHEQRCRTETQWPDDGFVGEDGPRHDVVIATDMFAFVPSLRSSTNVLVDEQPDFSMDLANDQDRIRRIVTGVLEAIDGPREVGTFEDLLACARHGWGNEMGKPHSQIETELFDALDDLGREWYFDADGAHTVATGLVRALWYAAQEEPNTNGRRKATVKHHPPRLDDAVESNDGWNRTWVTVTIDEQNRIQTLREAPDFSQARSVVGFDAWPNEHLWQRNAHPDVTIEEVLNADERALWRRIERGLTVVGVGDATRPPGADGEYFNEAHAAAIVEQLRAEFGEEFSKAGCASAVEDRMQELLHEADIPEDRLDTMHFGEEKSSNEFASEVVGLVYGCIDPGDDYVIDLLAECELDATPVMVEGPDGEQRREHGRAFEGPDADEAAALLASVRENHVAQMTGRFGRNLPDGQRSVVFVCTDAAPEGFVDVRVPGVTWLASPSQKQRTLLDYLRCTPGATARRAAEAANCSKEHARQVFSRLLRQGKATVRRASGEHGADEFRWAGALGPSNAAVSLTPNKITNRDVWGSCTWELAIPPRSTDRDRPRPDSPAGEWGSIGPQAVDGVDPPPDEAD
jgi:hypothetical protein